MKPQLFSGARGRIEFTDSDGSVHVLAFVTDISVSENAGLRPTFVIGAEGPVTIESLSIDVTASIGRVVPMNAPGKPSDAGVISNTAIDSRQLRFEENMNVILTKDDVTITIYDTKAAGGDKILASVRNARFAGRSTSTNSGDVSSERYNFVGIYDAGYAGTSNSPTETGYGFDSST